MESKQTAQQSLNFAPLQSVVTKADVADFKARHKPAQKPISRAWVIVAIAAGAIFFLVILGAFSSVRGAGSLGISPSVVFIWLVALSGFAAIAYFSSRKRFETVIRLERFAIANGMRLRYDVQAPVFAGMIFDEGHSRKLKEALVLADGTELGNYQYVTGSGKNRSTHNFGYIRIPLTRSLPHMVLDARSNNLFGALSNLPDTFHRDQTLSLEGDFDKYFTLYAPKQYERDALYVFTPDVMAKLIDEGKGYDMEVIGKELYVYTSGRIDLSDQAVLSSVLGIVSTIAAELRDQTAHYADERVGDRSANVVAPQGARLKRGVNWFVVGGIVLFLGYQFVPSLLTRDGVMLLPLVMPMLFGVLAVIIVMKKMKGGQ